MGDHWRWEDEVPKRFKRGSNDIALPDEMRLGVADPLARIRIIKPRQIRLSDGWIEWLAPKGPRARGRRKPVVMTREALEARFWPGVEYPRGILRDFLALEAQDDPSAFLAFAQRFGVLFVFQTEDGWRICADRETMTALRIREDEGWYRESIAGWRAVARHFGAIMLLASYLKEGTYAPSAVWTTSAQIIVAGDARKQGAWSEAAPEVFERRSVAFPEMKDFWPSLLRQKQAYVMGAEISALLSAARLTPRMSWDLQGARVTLAPVDPFHAPIYPYQDLRGDGDWGWSLFPILVAELAAMLDPAVNLERCVRCLSAYEASRKARSDQPHYCEKCRKIVRRESTRRSVARHRAKASL
ncbi:MAG: hypothetical protein ACR2JW_17510 [Thermomicrobiales bacterium]